MIESLQLSIATTITNLSAAKEIASSLLTIRDLQKYGARISEMLDSIIKAKEMISTMQDRESTLTAKIEELEKEITRLKDWNLKKEQYEKKCIANGVFAYMMKGFKGLPQNEEKLCCNCFEKNIGATLNQGKEGRMITLICPNGCPQIPFDTIYLSNKDTEKNLPTRHSTRPGIALFLFQSGVVAPAG